tara:strand:+ start:121 stop:402 length:282 start_codon:yes stop_codon:yes gene_type:complete
MKTFKSLISEKETADNVIEEAVNISKLKRLNLVDDEEFGKFVRVMKKMDGDKSITLKEKDIIMGVFNELVNAIVNDQSLLQKVAKRKTGDDKE